MSSIMNGMRSRTHSRTNTARTNATRLGFISSDIKDDDSKSYGWVQDFGPSAIEDTVNWTEEHT